MRKSIKFLSLIFTLMLIFVGISCKNKTDYSAQIASAKEKIEELSIPETISGDFEDITLYQSDIDGVSVSYSLSENVNGTYLKIENYILSFVAMPSSSLDATLTASITAGDLADSVVFNIKMGTTIDPTKPIYNITVTAINERKLEGALISFSKDGIVVDSGETNDQGVYGANIDSDVYDVTIYAPNGFVFEDNTDVYTTKTDRNATPISVECIPTLIYDETLPSGQTYSTGDQMYDFTVETYDPNANEGVGSWGNTWTLSEKLVDNELVVINFWYTGCTWCGTEFPLLIETYNDFVEQGFKLTVLAITYTYDDKQKVQQYINSFDANNEVKFNLEVAISDEMTAAFNVTAFPTTVFVDRYGTADYIESGAITNASRWANLFQTYLGDDYVPKYKGTGGGAQEQVKPDVEFPDSAVLEAILNKDGFVAHYYETDNETDIEYSWPFVQSPNDPEAVVPANSGVDNSYAIMRVMVELKAGQAFAFDYKASSEEDMDILYLIHDGAIVGTYSGIDEDYQTVYPFVADKDGTYQFDFTFVKDTMAFEGDDIVYLKNFRYVDPADIEDTLFVLRETTNDLDPVDGVYLDIKDVVFNSVDGYYHIGDVNGPLLLADIMSASHFSNDTLLSYAETEQFEGEIENDEGNLESLNDIIIRYAQAAVNSLTSGYTPITEELKKALEEIALELGTSSAGDETYPEWLEMTVYYNVYGKNAAEDERVNPETLQIIDPTIGLTHHSAINIELNETPGEGYEEETNIAQVEYEMNRFVTTRGFYFKFTPEVSGVYLIYGMSGQNVNCYVQSANFEEYANINENTRYLLEYAENKVADYTLYNYFEAGTTYYIIPFYQMYGEYGKVDFKIDYLGEEYVVLEKASEPAYTTSEDFTEAPDDIESIIVSRGINVKLSEEDGYYHEVYSDGSMSKDPIMFDFTLTNMLINQTFEKALEISLDPETEAKDRAYNLEYTEYGDSVIDDEGYLVEWTYVLDVTTNTLTSHSERVLENGQPVKADTSIYRDWTSDVQNWYETMLIPDGGIDDEGKYSNANGCIPVTAEIKEFLELLMNKYSFKDVENSWLKLCYYYHYYGANEHASDVLYA